MKVIKFAALIAVSFLLANCKEGAVTTQSTITVEDRAHLNTGGLQWMSMDDLARKKESGSKIYLIDIYTEWCGWCKVMDNKTFSDPRVQEILEADFHIVKFDAERKDPILFNGKTYEWQAGGRKGNNSLAVQLLDGKMSYPSLVYLDKDLNRIRISTGYKNPDQLIQELEVIKKS